jgi:hypothetical protein
MAEQLRIINFEIPPDFERNLSVQETNWPRLFLPFRRRLKNRYRPLRASIGHSYGFTLTDCI